MEVGSVEGGKEKRNAMEVASVGERKRKENAVETPVWELLVLNGQGQRNQLSDSRCRRKEILGVHVCKTINTIHQFDRM